MTYQLALIIPGAQAFAEQDEAYRVVLGTVPRILVAGWLAVFVGDILNNYVLARLKVMTRGRYLWLRTIGSALIGQSVNTAVFYIIAFSFVLPWSVLLNAVAAGSLFKIAVEVLLTPVTYWAVSMLKKKEGVDYFDSDTNFNPFASAARKKI